MRFHPLPVIDLHPETDDTVSVSFGIPSELSGEFDFTQGQHLTLRREFNQEEVRRSYSICTSVFENDLRIAVKSIPQGLFSRFIHQTLAVGDVIDVQIDSNRLFGPRDEGLVFTDYLENVPEEFRELGATISMENAKGEIKNFLVTKLDDKTLTVDGNNPLCGRDVVFTLEILKVRNATDEEIRAGGKDIDFDQSTLAETFSASVSAKPFN